MQTDMINKLGPFAWLAAAVAFAETLVCIKFGHGMFKEPWPATTLYVWGILAGVSSAAIFAWSIQVYVLRKQKVKKRV